VLSALLQDHKLVSGLPTEDRDKELKELAYIIFAGKYWLDICGAFELRCIGLTSGFSRRNRYSRSSLLRTIFLHTETKPHKKSATALVSFVAAMITNPDAQAKAQAEIDSVLGYAARLPTTSDETQLPYVHNLILEILRWQPVTPTGMARDLSTISY
jgi:hypothetical protein